MIIRILLIFLFIVLAGFVLYFIYGVFYPAVKDQMMNAQDPLFSDVELNYVENSNMPNIDVSSSRAVVMQKENRDVSKDRLIYNGIPSCKLFNSIYDTPNENTACCLGFGDCVKVCPQEAIMINNGLAVVTKNCCGCGKCVEICPKNIIQLVPVSEISSEDKKAIPEQKYFKFWKSCYKIFNRK